MKKRTGTSIPRFRHVLPLVVVVLLSQAAAAAGMPWEAVFDEVVRSLTGPVAFGISVVVLVAAGLTWAFRPQGISDGFSNLIQVIFWLILTMLAVQIITYLFGPSTSPGALLGG